MGGVTSYLASWVITPRADDKNPDSATGLTARDVQLIQQTWAIVAQKSTVKQNGVELFMQLFKTYPYMQSYFRQFKGLSESELRTSPKLRAHALGAMNMLTAYVEHLEDVETLVALIQKMTVSHQARQIPLSDFEKLKQMLPSYLTPILGNKFTKEAEASWMRLMTTHNAVVAQTIEAMCPSKTK